MSSKSILIISSYTVSKFARFFSETQCSRTIRNAEDELLNLLTAAPDRRHGFDTIVTSRINTICLSSSIYDTLPIQTRLDSVLLADRMIGYWHHPVVRLSVCLSVTLCILTPRVGVHG